MEFQKFYEFENFRLDTVERVLLRDNKHVPLAPKAFQMLCVLVANHGKVVDKERLMNEVWADSFVEEGNLAFHARMIRKALDDDAAHPKFIETIPRRGYKFIAEVRSVSSEHRSVNNDGRAKPKKRSWMAVVSVVLFGAAVITITGWFAGNTVFRSEGAPILSTKFASEKITSSGNVEVAAISPDGAYAAYVDAAGGMQSVWMRQLSTGESIQIVRPTEDQYTSLSFSGDGKSIFFAKKPASGHVPASLYRITALGGVPVRVVENINGFASVSPDDKRLGFARCAYKPDNFCELLVADTDGQNERKLFTTASPNHMRGNAFSPDGRSIAVAYGNSFTGTNSFRIAEIDLETGQQRDVSERLFFDIKHLAWLPDASGIIFSAKELLGSASWLWHVSRSAGECSLLAGDPNSYAIVSLSRNADKMIATHVSNNFRLYFDDGTGARPLAAARDFAYAPDGHIVYASDDRNIWEINADGTGQRQLTNDPAIDFSPRVSPDGRFIYFTSNRSGRNQVWRMDADGTNQIQVTRTEGGFPRLVTTDGKFVLYLAGRTEQLWKVDTETFEETQLNEKKLLLPALSPNGKFAAHFIRTAGLFKIEIFRLADQQVERTMEYGEGKSSLVIVEWSPDSRSIYFITDDGGRNLLWRQGLDEKGPRMIADLGTEEIERFSPTPDGKGYAFTRGKWMHDAALLSGLQ